MRITALALAALLVPSLAACNRAQVTELRDALADGDTQRAMNLVRAPECAQPEDTACLTFIAKAFGSKEAFNPNNPDQAGAAAVALVLVRERRGDVVPNPDAWIGAIRTATGPGADAVRIAVAMRMAAIAPQLGKTIDDEKQALAVARAIGTAFPGACGTYAKLPNDPEQLAAMKPEENPDHSPCVQRDLKRSTGLGAAYGFGGWRALAGALALWNEELNALENGANKMQAGKAKDAVTAKLPAIRAATAACKPRKVDVPGNDWAKTMGAADAHAGTAPSASAKPATPSTSAH